MHVKCWLESERFACRVLRYLEGPVNTTHVSIRPLHEEWIWSLLFRGY
jgi:hypothetical protein